MTNKVPDFNVVKVKYEAPEDAGPDLPRISLLDRAVHRVANADGIATFCGLTSGEACVTLTQGPWIVKKTVTLPAKGTLEIPVSHAERKLSPDAELAVKLVGFKLKQKADPGGTKRKEHKVDRSHAQIYWLSVFTEGAVGADTGGSTLPTVNPKTKSTISVTLDEVYAFPMPPALFGREAVAGKQLNYQIHFYDSDQRGRDIVATVQAIWTEHKALLDSMKQPAGAVIQACTSAILSFLAANADDRLAVIMGTIDETNDFGTKETLTLERADGTKKTYQGAWKEGGQSDKIEVYLQSWAFPATH